MDDRSERGKAPAGGAPQPDELPREIRPSERLPATVPDEGAPLPDMPISRDPLLNPGPVPATVPREFD